MSITKEKAIEIGKKVLTDINYSSADLKNRLPDLRKVKI